MYENVRYVPGNFPGLRRGMNLAPMASAMGDPNMNPLASTPAYVPFY